MISSRPFTVAAYFGAMACFGALVGTDAAAQKVDFSGKRIELLVPFPPGGGSDVYSRGLAPFLEKHLPGNPTIIIRLPTLMCGNWRDVSFFLGFIEVESRSLFFLIRKC